MTDREERLLHTFLDDLGTASAPAGLARRVSSRIQGEHPSRASRFGAWFVPVAAALAIVALAGIALVVGGPKPSPSVPPAPPASASASPSASSGPSASSETSPSDAVPAPAIPTGSASPAYRLELGQGGAHPLPALVVDNSERVTAAAEVRRTVTSGADIEVVQGEAPDKVVVAWIGSACDQYAELSLGRNGTSVGVSTTSVPGSCDAMAIERAVELTFAAPIDARTLQGHLSIGGWDLSGWLAPKALWFADTKQGYVAGTGGDGRSVPGPAVVLETADGGQTMEASVVGWGTVTSMGAVVGADIVRRPVVGLTCATDAGVDPLCTPGLYRRDALRWTRVLETPPIGIATRDATIVAWTQGALPSNGSTTAFPPRTIWLSRDTGDHWVQVANPCDLLSMGMTSATFDRTGHLAVLCEGQGAGGSARKQLQRAIDDKATSWTTMPPLPDQGTGMQIDLTPDGYGFAWGARSPLISTIDGGTSWGPELGGADGETQVVIDVSAFAGGGGAAIVRQGETRTNAVEISDGGGWDHGWGWSQ